jgi:hypothetical protein
MTRECSRQRRVLLGVLTLGALGSLMSCASDPNRGYTLAPAYRSDISTIGVPIFEMADFAPGTVLELTVAIIK